MNVGEAAQSYFEDHGWASYVQGDEVWTVAGRSVDAIDVPKRLAGPTLRMLHARSLCVPVISVPGVPTRWVFIVRPAPPPVAAIETLLLSYDIRCLVAAERIALPPTGTPDGELTWVDPPRVPAPPFSVVAMSLLGVAAVLAA